MAGSRGEARMQPRKPRGLARFEPPIQPPVDTSGDCGYLSLPWEVQEAVERVAWTEAGRG